MKGLFTSALLMAGISCLAQQAQTPPGSITGVVTSAAGQPLKNALLHLQALPAGSPGQAISLQGQPIQLQGASSAYSTSSDAQGSFLFENLDPGRYTLSAERTGYLRATYSANGKSASSALDLTSGQQLSGISLKMTPQALISGTITNEDGEPYPNVLVSLSRFGYVNGHKQLQQSGGIAVSNADGVFAVGNLPAGSYYLSAIDQRGTRQERRGREGPQQGYVTTYYPGATDQASATPIQVTAGAVVRGADIRMRQATVFRVLGKVVDPASSAPPQQVNLVLTPKAPPGGIVFSPNSAGIYRNGAFEFSGVIPGVYLLQATVAGGGRGGAAAARAVTGREFVSVGNGDVEGIVVTLGQGLKVTGRIITDGPAPPPQPGAPVIRQRIMLTAEGQNLGGANTQAQDDGTFVLQDILPGLYRIQVNPLPQGDYIKSIRLGGQDVTRTLLDLTSGGGGQIDILLSPNAASVSGTVHDPSPDGNGQPLGGVMVTLWTPGVPAENANDFKPYGVTDANGQFIFAGVPPGEYRVAAWEQIDPGLATAPEFRIKFEGKAATVKRQENDHSQIEAPLIPRDSIEAEAAKLQ